MCWLSTTTTASSAASSQPRAAVGTGWAVESGLKAGETIIVHGLQKVTPGQMVETVASEK